MQVTIDISMYPFNEDFKNPIKEFISKLNVYENLIITTFPTSTTVQGEYECAMRAIQETILGCHRADSMASYVVKILPGYEAM
tara:strand:- start:186 stop:434 length:249 start_codon:yes stop_codon:yes gene_type:complete